MLHDETRKLLIEAWNKTHNAKEIAECFLPRHNFRKERDNPDPDAPSMHSAPPAGKSGRVLRAHRPPTESAGRDHRKIRTHLPLSYVKRREVWQVPFEEPHRLASYCTEKIHTFPLSDQMPEIPRSLFHPGVPPVSPADDHPSSIFSGNC